MLVFTKATLLLPFLLPVRVRRHWQQEAQLQAKVTLLARLNVEGFPFTSAQIGRKGIVFPVEHNGRGFEPDAIMSFYARYTDNGKRKMEPLGKDPVDAYARFQAIEANFTRLRAGLLPVHDIKAHGDAGHLISDAAREFKEDIASRGLKLRSIE